MHPEILRIPIPFSQYSIPIYSYGLALVIGIFAAIYVAWIRAKRLGISKEVLFDIAFYGAFSGVIGARIFHIIIYRDCYDWRLFDPSFGGFSIIGGIFVFLITLWYFLKKFRKNTYLFYSSFLLSLISAILGSRILDVIFHINEYQNPELGIYTLDIFKVYKGGLVSFGGFLIAALVIILYLRAKRLNVRKMADIIAISLILGLAFGRMGCLMRGCCYGKVTSLPIGISFPAASPAYMNHIAMALIPDSSKWSLPVHPTQVYSIINALLIYFILCFLYEIKRYDGLVIAVLWMLYGISRFIIEFLRDDTSSVFYSLKTAQIISIFLIISGFIYWIVIKRRYK